MLLERKNAHRYFIVVEWSCSKESFLRSATGRYKLTSLSGKYYHIIKNFDHVIKSFRYGSMPRVPNQQHGGSHWFAFFPWVLCQGCRDGLVRLIYGIFIVFSQLNLFITMLLHVTTRPETATMEGNKKSPLCRHTQKVFQL